MRPISQDMYGIPCERVIGSGSTFAYTSDDQGGTITHKPEADYLNDGPRRAFRLSGCFVGLTESEASDAIADHDNSDHEQKHNHDRHIVLNQPLP